MKASEIPEKIYLQQNTTTDLYEELWPEWFEARLTENDIQYTRTDAFINKACEWLMKNLWRYIYVKYDDTAKGYHKFKAGCDLNELIDAFRKYMEGKNENS